MNYYRECRLCPRNCGVDRSRTVGVCGQSDKLYVARAALHMWEEPCISGESGSGTVFFTGCNLGCVYCQNREISSEHKGFEITSDRLAEIFLELQDKGANNINLVTPTHYVPHIIKALDTVKGLDIPIVYNCGGYESVHTVAFLRKKIQCWLPDLKYSDAAAAERYSSAPDYFEKAVPAIEQMFRQTGPYEIGADGILKKGVLIRHLILPGQMKNTKGVLEYVAETFRKGDVLFSLMRQYTPHGRAEEFPEINRRITDEEYEEAEAYMEALGIEDGYIQQKESSDQSFIPVFDGTGVERAAGSHTKK